MNSTLPASSGNGSASASNVSRNVANLAVDRSGPATSQIGAGSVASGLLIDQSNYKTWTSTKLSCSLATAGTNILLHRQLDPETGLEEPTNGALIPPAYQVHNDDPEYPIICPVRTCRTLFPAMQNLAAHFSVCLSSSLSQLGVLTLWIEMPLRYSSQRQSGWHIYGAWDIRDSCSRKYEQLGPACHKTRSGRIQEAYDSCRVTDGGTNS